jgi:hypothetical protein
MASGSVIGALRVVLGADTAALDKGLKDAQGSLRNFAKQAAAIAAGIGLAQIAEKIANEFSYAIKQGFAEADKLNKLSQAIGVPVEELSALKYAAELSDVSLETLSTSMTRLNKAMSEGSDTFKIMGINIKNTDGTMKSSTVVLGEVANKFALYEDGANKTALAVSLFGRAGAAMIPMLNQGQAGLAGAAEEARKLGLIISTETAKAAENFNDNLTRLGKVKDGIILKITAHLAPAFENLSSVMFDATQKGAGVEAIAQAVEFVMNLMATATIKAVAGLQNFNLALTMLSTAWDKIKSADFAGVAAAWEQYSEAGRKNLEVAQQLVDRVWNPGPLDAHLAALQRVNAGVNNLTFSFGGVAAPALASADAMNKVNAEGLALYNQMISSGKRLMEESRTPLEEYKAKLAEISMLLQQGAIDAPTWERAQAKAAFTVMSAYADGVTQAVGGFQQLFTVLGKENSKFARTAQALAIVEATINTLVAFTKALSLSGLPPPLNIAAAAGVLAAGMAKVAMIRSQKVPAMRTGGVIRVPGAGGPDSRRINLDASPGEELHVKRPGDPGYGRSGSAPEVPVVINGWSIGREQVRQLFDAMNDMHGDGYKLKLA